MKDVEKLEPRAFTKFCMSIGAVPSSYLAALSIEEQLLWLCSYLEKEVIPAVNNNGEAVSELQNLYIELHDYVEHYFDNLDVQEEINNKLDKMAEDGDLATLLAPYIISNCTLNYNTLADLKGADNLSDGSFVQTYGNASLNDGQGRLYKIRTKNVLDVVDDVNIIGLTNYPNLVGELIVTSNPTQQETITYLGSGADDDYRLRGSYF